MNRLHCHNNLVSKFNSLWFKIRWDIIDGTHVAWENVEILKQKYSYLYKKVEKI